MENSVNINSDALKQFVPALVYSLYDGYYVYSKYANTENRNEETGDATYEYGLEPYIYYSCRYINGNTDCIINFTLDNAITVYGTVRGEYVVKTGYLINPSSIGEETRRQIDSAVARGETPTLDKIEYDDLTIQTEDLSETLILLEEDSGGNTIAKKSTYPYHYTFYHNKKVYRDQDENGNPLNTYFWYDNYKKTPVYDENTRTYARNTIGKTRSAVDYYTEAYIFSSWVEKNLGELTMNHAYDKEGNKVTFESNNTGDNRIFHFDKENNNPEKSASVFNSHRVAVIRKTIETSLIAALANYNKNVPSTYEYRLPKLAEEDWYKITNEVSVTAFMQGLPMKSKYFNEYCVISNNQNKEFISKSSITLLGSDGNYHKPNCKIVVDHLAKTGGNEEFSIKGAYTKLALARQKVKLSEENSVYFFPQQVSSSQAYLSCYECTVNIADVYDLDELIDGTIMGENQMGQEVVIYQKDKLKEVRTIYFTALAREKQDLYKSISFLE